MITATPRLPLRRLLHSGQHFQLGPIDLGFLLSSLSGFFLLGYRRTRIRIDFFFSCFPPSFRNKLLLLAPLMNVFPCGGKTSWSDVNRSKAVLTESALVCVGVLWEGALPPIFFLACLLHMDPRRSISTQRSSNCVSIGTELNADVGSR